MWRHCVGHVGGSIALARAFNRRAGAVTAGYAPEARPRFPLVFALLDASYNAARMVPPAALHGAPDEKPALAASR